MKPKRGADQHLTIMIRYLLKKDNLRKFEKFGNKKSRYPIKYNLFYLHKSLAFKSLNYSNWNGANEIKETKKNRTEISAILGAKCIRRKKENTSVKTLCKK